MATTVTVASSVAASLHEAVFSPHLNLAEVEELIRKDPASLSAVNPQNGMTPLQGAARRGHSGLVQVLVAGGAELEVRGKNGETPFLVACQVGSLYAVHALVEAGTNVRAVDKQGRSAMHLAAQVGAVHIMHYLSVTQGLGFQCTDKEGYTPLHLAVTNRNLETVRYLLRHNRADACTANMRGTTPLHIAANLGSLMMSWMLVTSTKENVVGYKDANGYTAVDHAKMGLTPRHKVLARKLKAWSGRFSPFVPQLQWLLFLVLPGTALLAAMLLFCQLGQPQGFVLAIFVVIGGFFWPMIRHRIPHEAGLPNPALFGALLSGLIHTFVCYFAVVFPRIWPDNLLWFTVVLFNSLLVLYLLIKLQRTDPGFDRVGKLGSDGNPMTIVDVAGQGQPGHTTSYFFCTSCEIVIPERTKHCKLCNGCCNGFDHHCMWLRACIGYNNHRFFVMFAFFLGLDNFLFIREAVACVVAMSDSYNPMTVFLHAFSYEKWILFLIVCNFCTGVFAFLNTSEQVNLISRMETKYFDVSGQAAFKKKRQRKQLPLLARWRLAWMFFTDYPRWYRINDPHGQTTFCV